MGARGIHMLGVMETDPLIIQAEQKLIHQADELIVLADSSKFSKRSSLILCQLEQVNMVITDEGIDDKSANMLEVAGVKLIVAKTINKNQKSSA